MKKFVKIMSVFMCVLASVFFAACGNDNKKETITVNQTSITMNVGDTKQIADYFKYENIKAENISFKSLDEDIVKVLNGEFTAIKNGNTFIQAESKKASCLLEIKVLKPAPNAGVPTGLKFDKQQNAIVWNPVAVNLENEIKQVNSYTLSLDLNGTIKTVNVVGQTKYNLTTSGNYKVKVKSNEYKENDIVLYKESNYSKELSLTKLASPTNIKYDDETNILSWDKIENVEFYQVKINDVTYEKINTNSFSVDLNNNDIKQNQQYKVTIFAISMLNQQKDDVVSYGESKACTFTRLYAPKLTLKNGQLVWNNFNSGDFHYELVATNQEDTTFVLKLDKTISSSINFAVGGYKEIKLVCKSDSNLMLSSTNVSSIKNVEKLEKPTIVFDSVENKINISGNNNKKVVLNIYHNNDLEKVEIKSAPFSYDWNKTLAGEYKIEAYVLGDDVKDINSNMSNQITINQLESIDANNLTQKVENKKYYINHNLINGADKYEYYLTFKNSTKQIEKQADGSFGLVDELFFEEGEYQILIKVSSSKISTQNSFVLPSTTTLKVVRQQNVQNLQYIDSNKQILWDSVLPSNKYTYYVTKNGDSFETQTTMEGNIYSLQNFDFGTYRLFIKATQVNLGNTLYLESLNYAFIDAPVTYTLKSPEILFNRAEKTASFNKVANALNYVVTLNDKITLTYQEQKGMLVVNLGDKLNDAGEYTLTVQAVNEENVLIKDSKISSIVITKLTAPTTFNFGVDGELQITSLPNDSVLNADKKYVVTVNNVETNIVGGEQTTFNVTAQFLANTLRVDNNYYLDSNVSNFTINRATAPTDINLTDTIISWKEYKVSNFNYKVNVTQQDKNKVVTKQENSLDVLTELDLIDLTQDFDLSVVYNFMGGTINLAEDSNVFFTSLPSQKIVVHKIKSNLKMSLQETDTNIFVNWETPTDVTNATYTLFVDGNQVYKGQENVFDIKSLITQERSYPVRLQITKPGYISSEYIEINVEKLPVVDKIEIDDNENVLVKTKYDSSVLDTIKITKDGKQITNLTEFSGKFEIEVQLVSNKTENKNTYYVNSNVKKFKFSRINTFTAPLVMDNTISWDEVYATDSFRLTFSVLDKTYLVDFKDLFSVQTTNEKVAKALREFSSNKINVAVKAVISAFTTTGDEHLLSSYNSPNSTIVILNKVSNIKIESNLNDTKQQDVKILWDYDFTDLSVKQINLNIYHNGQLLSQEVITGQLNSFVATNMTQEGVYYCEIQVLGTNECLDSVIAKSTEITRLASPTNLSVSNDNILSWTGVNGAVCYEVSYTSSVGVNGTLSNIKTTNVDITSVMQSKQFEGVVNFTVLAVGGQGKDEYKTLSSNSSLQLAVEKISVGNLTLDVDNFVVGNQDKDSFDILGAKYLITIKIDNRVVKTTTLNFSEKYVYEDFYYQDTMQKVATDVEKEVVIEVVRQLDKVNYVNSDVNIIKVTKLQTPTNVGFIRKNSEEPNRDSQLFAVGDKNANASKFALNVNGQTVFGVVNNGIYEIVLEDNLYNKISSGNVEFNFYNIGSINKQGTKYINSSNKTLNVTKLQTPQNFTTTDGYITWSKVEDASDYVIKKDNNLIKQGYVVGGVHNLKETFEGVSGLLKLNIKAIGNVSTVLKTENVVLDSSYIVEDRMGNGEFTYKEIRFEKLSIPQNFRGINGFLACSPTSSQKNIEYQAQIGEDIYVLTNKGFYDGKTYNLLYSSNMYDKLKANLQYQVKIRAVSYDEKTLYSEYTEKISIKILPNDVTGSLNFGLKILSTNPTKYDYATAQIKWIDTINAKNGYKVLINANQVYEFDVDTPYFNLENPEYKISTNLNTVRVVVKGNSTLNSDGCYELDSIPSEGLEFYKLRNPNVSIQNGKLAWSNVVNATGYLVYLDDMLYSETPISSTSLEINLGDLVANKTYLKYEVKAISENAKYVASDKVAYTNPEGLNQSVTKFHAPNPFSITEGKFVWTLDYATMQQYVAGNMVETPFSFNKDIVKASQSLSDYSTFNQEAKAYNYIINYNNANTFAQKDEQALKDAFETLQKSKFYIYIQLINNQTKQQTQIKMNPFIFCVLLGDSQSLITEEFITADGWPSLSFGYEDVNFNPACGEYTYYLSQPGDDYQYLNSNLSNAVDFYLPHAPRIKISYTTNNYELSWNAISIPQQYAIQNPTYQVIVETNKGIRKVLQETEQTNINLTHYIENGELNSDYTKIFVRVKGNSNNVLNGKNSNNIKLKVLSSIEAYINSGKLSWHGQEGAGEYIISYTEKNDTQTTKVITTQNTIWDCLELNSNIEYYTIFMNAVGQTVSTYDYAVLTGPTTNLGKLSKLVDPIVSVDNGMFKWKAVKHCSSYYVYTQKEHSDEIMGERIQGLQDLNGDVWFETNLANSNVKYTFMAMGEMSSKLSDRSHCFVNSNIVGDTYATALDAVKRIYVKNGELRWEVVNNQQKFVSYYKLTFTKINNYGEELNSQQIITGGNFRPDDISPYCVYDVSDLQQGRYKVAIQPYYQTGNAEGVYTYREEDAYYLLGLKNVNANFTKYDVVQSHDQHNHLLKENVSLIDGEFNWEYAGEDNYANNFEYELEFVSSLGKHINFKTDKTSYNKFISDKLVVDETYELKIRVVPKSGVDDFVCSNFVTYKNIQTGNSTTIYQLNSISEADVILTNKGQKDDIYISWEKYKVATGEVDVSSKVDVEYIVTYWIDKGEQSGKENAQSVVVKNKYYNTVDMSFNITENHVLYYTIQVKPVGENSYIASRISEVRDIKKPDSVTSVTFDKYTQTFSWSEKLAAKDHCYKIKDEILKVNNYGQLVYDKDKNPIVVRTYIYTTTSNAQTTYVPMEQGYHKVSVAVTVRASGGQANLDSEYKYYTEDVKGNSGTPVLINLFDVSEVDIKLYSGAGTKEHPYIIANEKHFDNIKYRMEKPEYQFNYILTEEEVVKKVTLDSYNQIYYFKQKVDIENVVPFGLGKITTFTGVYDGNFNTLTWQCDLSQMVILNKKHMALFAELGTTAVIKNIKIRANFVNTLTAGGTISIIAYKNMGTIQNVIVGNKGDSLRVDDIEMFFNGVCGENSGVITQVVTNYNITLNGTRNAYSGITAKNNQSGKVIMCANYGNIQIDTINATSAGIVGVNDGLVERCVLKNDSITIDIPKVSADVYVTFGGIVGKNVKGTISYSYVHSNIHVYRTASNVGQNQVYIAGLVGKSENDKITRSYVNVNITTTSGETVEIGNIYLFVAYVEIAQSGVDRYNYCNKVKLHGANGGDANFKINQYEVRPNGANMNETDKQYYTNNENVMPTLVWENQFKGLWSDKF